MLDDAADLYGPKMALKAWWSDFDLADDQSAIDRQIATALCVIPVSEENDKLRKIWSGWMKEDPADPDAVIWGALTALDAKVFDFIVGKSLPDFGKLDRLTDMGRNTIDAIRAHLKKRNHSGSLQVTASDMASHLIHVKLNQPGSYRVEFEEKLMKVISVRTDVTIVARSEQVTKIQLEGLLDEAIGIYKHKILQTLTDEKVLVVKDQTRQHPIVLWLPEELSKELSKLPPLPVGELASTPALNPHQKMLEFIKKSEIGTALAWVGLVLQTFNLANSAGAALNEDASSKDKGNAPFGILSGVLGISALLLDIYANKQPPRAAVVGRLWAGGLSLVASLVDIANASYNAYKQWNAGNKTSAMAYGGAVGATAVAAVIALRIALVVVGFKAFVITIFMSAFVLAVNWFAEKFADTEFETWIKKSALGSKKYPGKKYDDEATEMKELVNILYGSARTIKLHKTPPPRGRRLGTIYWFSMGLPGANDANTNSALYCKITLRDKKKAKAHEIIFESSIRPVRYTLHSAGRDADIP